MHSNVTIKNVSWPHFSWATLYVYQVCHGVSRCVKDESCSSSSLE